MPLNQASPTSLVYLAPFDLGFPAGHTAHVVASVRELVRQGVQVTLLAKAVPPSLRNIVRFVPVATLPYPGLQAVSFGTFAAAVVARELRRNDGTILYARYFTSVSCAIALAKALDRKVAIEVNASLANERRNSRRGALAQALEVSEERAAFGMADAVIAVNHGIGRELEAAYPRLTGRVAVIENGVDTELYHPLDKRICRDECGLSSERKYAVFAGALQKWQGAEDFIAALAIARNKEPSLFGIIVGDGPERANAARAIASWGIAPFVQITGYQPETMVAKYLSAADVCLAPYNTQAVDDFESDKTRYGATMRGSPLKVLTYMSSGCAIVATHFAEAGAYLAAHDLGLAVPPEQPEALAQAMLTLLNDEPRARALGDRARARALSTHGWDRTVRATLGHLRNL